MWTVVQQYRFRRAIFGLKLMTPFFQRVMRAIFADYFHFIVIYVDNLIVYSSCDVGNHLSRVLLVLRRLTELKLTIRRDKCKWFKYELRLPGHHISAEGIRIDPVK